MAADLKGPTKFRLVVTFRLEHEPDGSKSLSVEHLWDFVEPETMRWPVLLRTLRHCLLSVIRTATWASVVGWKEDPEFTASVAGASQEEYERAVALSRTSDPPEDLEMAGPN